MVRIVIYQTGWVEFTRPADATAYATADVIGTTPGTVLTFADAAPRMGGIGRIVGATIVKNSTGALGGTRLAFYSTPPTAIDDNSPAKLLYADSYLGEIRLDTMATYGTGSDAMVAQAAFNLSVYPSLVFRADTSTRNLYAVLMTTGAYTPTSGEKFKIRLDLEWQVPTL